MECQKGRRKLPAMVGCIGWSLPFDESFRSIARASAKVANDRVFKKVKLISGGVNPLYRPLVNYLLCNKNYYCSEEYYDKEKLGSTNPFFF